MTNPGQSTRTEPPSRGTAVVLHMRLALLVLPILSGITSLTLARDTLRLSLTAAIRLAQERGPVARSSAQQFQNREHGYRAFRAGFLPQLTIQGDLPGYTRSISSVTQPDGTQEYRRQQQMYSTVSVGISQIIPATGTQISLLSSVDRFDQLDPSSMLYATTPLQLSIRQPVFSINASAWNADIEDLRYRAARRSAVEALEDCAIDVTNKFFDHDLAFMNVQNAALNLAINDTLYQISKGRFNVGKIAENDLLQSELAVLTSQTQLENARLALDRAARALLFALDLPLTTSLIPEPEDLPGAVKVDTAQALAHARHYRSDALTFALQKLTAERDVREARSNNSFSLILTANVGLNQSASVLQDAYRNPLDRQQFNLHVGIPLFGFGSGNEAVDAALAAQQQVETNVQMQQFSFDEEVLYQIRRFELLQTQVAVAAKADTIAQRRFDVARQRYVIGKIDVPNLFLAQGEKDNAYRARIQTLWDYWVTYYRVRRVTLYDFVAGRALVERDDKD